MRALVEFPHVLCFLDRLISIFTDCLPNKLPPDSSQKPKLGKVLYRLYPNQSASGQADDAPLPIIHHPEPPQAEHFNPHQTHHPSPFRTLIIPYLE